MFVPSHPFYMIRHGQTDWNKEGRFQGQTDIPINFKGRQQAAYNGRKLKALIGDAQGWNFISSPMGRTRQTMEIARTQMDLDQSDYAIDQRLIEITFGDWEKQTLEEIGKKFPFEVQKRSINKWNFRPPGGESYADVQNRAAPVFEQLMAPSLIVTHGGIIRAIQHLIEGIDENTAANLDIPQDRIYHFDGQKGGWI